MLSGIKKVILSGQILLTGQLFLFNLVCYAQEINLEKKQLKVLLYSHVPTGNKASNFTTIKNRIKKEFESRNPGIKLTVDMDALKLDTYKILDKQEAITGMISKDGYDLIEIDTLYLDKLVEKKLISPIEIKKRSQYMKSAMSAITIDGKEYGAPTMMCSYYLAHSKKNQGITLGGKDVTISGMYSDSMVISLVYSALYSQLNSGSVSDFSKKSQDRTLVEFSKIIKKCKNYKCTTKDYFYSKDLAKTLDLKSTNKHDVAIAYSQILHYLKMKDPNFQISPFKLEDKAHPIFSLTNSLVVNKSRCNSKECLAKAQRFIDYYSSSDTLSWLSLNKDNPKFPARYLSPSVESFYTSKEVKNDKDYQVIYKNLIQSHGISYKELLKHRKNRAFETIDFLIKQDPKYQEMKKMDLWIKEF